MHTLHVDKTNGDSIQKKKSNEHHQKKKKIPPPREVTHYDPNCSVNCARQLPKIFSAPLTSVRALCTNKLAKPKIILKGKNLPYFFPKASNNGKTELT